MGVSGNWVTCPADTWTVVWEAPSPGFTYLTAGSGAGTQTIQWQRTSSGFPWNDQGAVTVSSNQVTLNHGGPGLYTRLRVRSPVQILLRAH